jgi:hypothetical protein
MTRRAGFAALARLSELLHPRADRSRHRIADEPALT